MDGVVTFPEMIACVDRELKFRLAVYPRWCSGPKPKMTTKAMNQELERMRAVRRELVRSAALQLVLDEVAKEAGVPMGAQVSRVEEAERQLQGSLPGSP